ncbi:MAG: ribosome-binding factor A [bacterium]
MASHRVAQVNEVIRREVASALRRFVEIPPSCLVTIEEVQTSRDLSRAKIAVSVYPASFRADVLRLLNEEHREIQQAISHRLIFRVPPKLVFSIDMREERADRINRLLDEGK